MKKIVIPYNENQIDLTCDLVDGYIIGIKNLCVNIEYQIDIDKLDDLMTKLIGKDIFIMLNKNMDNDDLDILKDTLLKLSNYPIKGVLYSDVCFMNFKNMLDYPLIWTAEHASTNYDTINYWIEKGIKGAYLSSDITHKEVLEIANKMNCMLMVNILGYLPMFVSKRHIVKNYLNQFHIDDNSSIYYMEKEGKVYPIIDNEIGTTVYSNSVLNGINEYYSLMDNKIDYVVFNGFEIDDQLFYQVMSLVKSITKENVNSVYDSINELISNSFSGFMYRDTISKVKNNG